MENIPFPPSAEENLVYKLNQSALFSLRRQDELFDC